MGAQQQQRTDLAWATSTSVRSWRGQGGECVDRQASAVSLAVEQGKDICLQVFACSISPSLAGQFKGPPQRVCQSHHLQTVLAASSKGRDQQLSGGALAISALRLLSSHNLLAVGSLGGWSETSGGRHLGTGAISLTPCTSSASQQFSTSTWQLSPMPSPLGACWGTQQPTCRSVCSQGAKGTIVCPSLGFQCQARAPHSGASPAPGRMRDGSCLKTQPAGTDGAGGVLVCCPTADPGELQPHLFALQGVLESFLGTAFAGSIFCLFSGQPLTILSSTGPVLVFERLLFSFSE